MTINEVHCTLVGMDDVLHQNVLEKCTEKMKVSKRVLHVCGIRFNFLVNKPLVPGIAAAGRLQTVQKQYL